MSHNTERVSPLLFNSYKVLSPKHSCAALLLIFTEDVFPSVKIKIAVASSPERQLRSLIESYGFASLRYAAAGGMRSFRHPPLRPAVSRERRVEKANVSVATVLTCGVQFG